MKHWNRPAASSTPKFPVVFPHGFDFLEHGWVFEIVEWDGAGVGVNFDDFDLEVLVDSEIKAPDCFFGKERLEFFGYH